MMLAVKTLMLILPELDSLSEEVESPALLLNLGFNEPGEPKIA